MGEKRQSLDRLNIFLSDKLNLVTIQLGENVSDTSRFGADLEELISYVQQRAPKAQIIVIGDFWDKRRNDMREKAAQNKGVTFVDLFAIIGDKSYQSKEGTPCLLDDGSTMIVNKAAETHPGDKGRAYISDKVIEKIHG